MKIKKIKQILMGKRRLWIGLKYAELNVGITKNILKDYYNGIVLCFSAKTNIEITIIGSFSIQYTHN